MVFFFTEEDGTGITKFAYDMSVSRYNIAG